MAYVDSSSTPASSHSGGFKGKSVDIQSGCHRQCEIHISPNAHECSISFPDKTRGVFNEGGLYGERKGWHLPGFDTSSWESRDLSHGLPKSAAGVGFFVTTFDLHIPEGLDVPMSFNFNEPLGQPYRAYLFVNGWMMGKRVGNLG